jgi:hypothetical protein
MEKSWAAGGGAASAAMRWVSGLAFSHPRTTRHRNLGHRQSQLCSCKPLGCNSERRLCFKGGFTDSMQLHAGRTFGQGVRSGALSLPARPCSALLPSRRGVARVSR